MGLCVNCKKFFPPQFMTKKDLCIFCFRNTNEIYYGPLKSKKCTRDEIVKEYDIFIKKLKESPSVSEILNKDILDNEVLKIEPEKKES